MRTFTTIAMLVAATLAVAAGQDTPTFKATTQIVSVPATAVSYTHLTLPTILRV